MMVNLPIYAMKDNVFASMWSTKSPLMLSQSLLVKINAMQRCLAIHTWPDNVFASMWSTKSIFNHLEVATHSSHIYTEAYRETQINDVRHQATPWAQIHIHTHASFATSFKLLSSSQASINASMHLQQKPCPHAQAADFSLNFLA